MKTKSNIKIIIFYTLLCVLTVAIDWLKWGIKDRLSSLAEGWIILFAAGAVAVTLAALLIYGILHLRRTYRHSKTIKAMSVIPCVIVVFTLLIHTVIPVTNAYMSLSWKLNQNAMETAVELLESRGLSQTNVSRYRLPSRLRLASHTGMIYTQTEISGATKALFYVHCGGWKSSAVIYVSDDSGVADGDFGRVFESVRKLKDHWYAAVMRWLE